MAMTIHLPARTAGSAGAQQRPVRSCIAGNATGGSRTHGQCRPRRNRTADEFRRYRTGIVV